jgi:flagellar motility protein MotE (MotC chaperone)
MTRLIRDFRLLPLVLIAALSLLALKSFGLIFEGGYILAPSPEEARHADADAGDVVGSIPTAEKEPTIPDAPAVTAPVMPSAPPADAPSVRQSWAQEMFNFPDVTGSIGGGKKEEVKPSPGETKLRNESPAQPQVRTAAKPPPTAGRALEPRAVSASERAILERLQERRKDLEGRARQLDMRETLLKAAEKRLEARLSELKQVEGRIKAANEKTEETTQARFKCLVAMYENMKAKDAARIFDRLELKILAELAGHINPRRMADILASMSPEAAERLTVEFASRGQAQTPKSPADLPKIEGRPIKP